MMFTLAACELEYTSKNLSKCAKQFLRI